MLRYNEVIVWVRKSFKYDGNKLPRVVPTCHEGGFKWYGSWF